MQLKKLLRNHSFFFLYVLVVLFINVFFFRIVFVYGNSMEPTLHDNQLLVVRLINYKPTSSDIIITTKENPFHCNLIKRIIATEGDTVLLTESTVYVNDIMLQEPYVSGIPSYTPLKLTVPAGHVFIMGDNRNFSKDSRDIGCIPITEIIGKIIQ